MPAIFNDLMEFRDENDLDSLLNKMDNLLAVKLLEVALESCNDRFTLVESHVVYECLKKLKQNKDGFNNRDGELQQGEGHSSS
jgi:hypothetical protein